ncbi:UDP-glucose 4-epimerase GalE [Ferrovibrio sp.]|uniref:UDP-glucose 4-epimerase GalE n=1 Tax=Ferrovibrio sp. TaxID=1917215 RepID=UPI00311E1F7C
MSDGPAILVAGGAGFVGSHVCKALAAAGFRPVVYDDLSAGHEDAVRWGPLERGDIRDGGRLAAVLAQHRPMAALHFAARIEAGESMRDPGAFYAVNVGGTLSLLQALREAGIGICVFSSTAAVYGLPQSATLAESHPLLPVNPYGATKLAAERMLADFAYAHGSRFVALRYFNAAGADPDGELGERHDPETHLIPLVLQAAAGQRPQIAVYGTDYPTPDGTCIRDYVHVSDLAAAHVLALRHLLGGGDSARLNLGNGSGFSVRQVIDAARHVTGRAIPVQEAARRAGDPPVLVADAAQSRAVLGWQPQRAALETQIGDAWAWLRKTAG